MRDLKQYENNRIKDNPMDRELRRRGIDPDEPFDVPGFPGEKAKVPKTYMFPFAGKDENGKKKALWVLASDDLGWEHVSVSVVLVSDDGDIESAGRTPTWEEMAKAKDLFFEKDETCIEYHPAMKDYVNMNPNVLHIWRPVREALPTPPKFLVGF